MSSSERAREAARAAAPAARRRPESWCAPTARPLSTSAIGTSPSRSATAGSSSSSCASRIAQASPAGPPPTIATPTSSCSSAGASGARDDLGRRERRRVRSGDDRHAPIVLSRIGGAVHAAKWHPQRVPLGPARRVYSQRDADRSPLRHRHPPDARDARGDGDAPRSATTCTARTRPSTRSSAGPPSCAAARPRCSCRRGRWGTRSASRSGPGRATRSTSTATAHILIDEAGGDRRALGRAPARPARPGLRARRRRAARRRADGRRPTSIARAPACSASRTRTRARAGACGRPRRSSA